jgi:hypothetical protein
MMQARLGRHLAGCHKYCIWARKAAQHKSGMLMAVELRGGATVATSIAHDGLGVHGLLQRTTIAERE